MARLPTASQTVGPYFSIGLDWLNTTALASDTTQGTRITVEGRITDGDGAPVPDAVVEIWQADANGRYAHPEDKQEKPRDESFRGFGRCPTDKDGTFRFQTVKPGAVPGPGNTLQAPHIVVSIGMRGLLKRIASRLYFEDEAANADDPILNLIEDAGRRKTLIARREGSTYRWDVKLQGAGETVFFDV